jgi:hypothetical protein
MVFAIADSTKSLVDGSAGNNEQEKDILRSVFGKIKPVGSVPAYVEEVGASKLKMGADCISCMFAIHYFFESSAKLNGFLENLSQTLKVGGYFIGSCFDGQKVFDLLANIPNGKSKTGSEGTTKLWEITKKYDAEEIPEGDGGFGLPIDVNFISIGAPHEEFLVPFRLLEDKMRLIGCELLSADELKQLGMVNSTATFDVSWEMAKKKGTTFKMGAGVKEFSFLNRWFIFKRQRQETMATAVVAEAENANVSNGVRGLPPNAGRAANARAKANAVAAAASAIQKNASAVPNAAAPAVPDAPAAAENRPANAPGNKSAKKAAANQGSRTVAVAPGPAADPATKKSYAVGEIFEFYINAPASKDILGIEDPGAARWLAPGAPFRIKDGDVEYPSIEHYMGGMRVKIGGGKPAQAVSLFSREGSIHQRFLNDRLGMTNGGTKSLPEEEDYELLKTELAAVKTATGAVALKKYGVIINEAEWETKKESSLQEALKQRWTMDKRFRKIVETARNQGKYLLYYTPGATTNLGGKRDRNTGQIEGDNKVGKIIMKLSGYPE